MSEASYSIFTAMGLRLKMVLSMKLNKESEFEKKKKRKKKDFLLRGERSGSCLFCWS